MFKIVRRRDLNPTVIMMDIEAPLVANKAKAGQFIILRVDEEGERIPLTVAGTNKKEGTVEIIFQVVGGSTLLLAHKQVGDYLQDFVGPLGEPSEVEGFNKVCVIALFFLIVFQQQNIQRSVFCYFGVGIRTDMFTYNRQLRHNRSLLLV